MAGLLAFLDPLEMVVGSLIGVGIYGVLSNPNGRGVWTLLLVGIGMPFVVGMIDLALRLATP